MKWRMNVCWFDRSSAINKPPKTKKNQTEVLLKRNEKKRRSGKNIQMKIWNKINLRKYVKLQPKLIKCEGKNICGNEIKRCFLNNVLRRFDKEGQRNNRHRRFHRLLPPTMRKILLVHAKNPVDAHCRKWKCYKHQEIDSSHDHKARLSNTGEAIFELSPTQTKSAAWKLSGNQNLLLTQNYCRLSHLHYAVLVFLHGYLDIHSGISRKTTQK